MKTGAYKPKVIKGRVHDSGLPIDGHVILFALWSYDDHGSYHLYEWNDDADDAVMRTMHQTDELYADDDIEQFRKMWDAGDYDSPGSFCLELDKVEVLEVLQEEENA